MVQRFATAIKRHEYSRPIATSIRDGIITKHASVFDYGCGRADDIRNLESAGYDCAGWDPEFMPDTQVKESDIVNLGYVLNVIEDTKERAETLRTGFSIARKVLVVSVLTDLDSNRAARAIPYEDGLLTSRGTFQKYFTQTELREYVKDVLGVEPVSAGLGIVYVFKNETQRQLFLANRLCRRPRTSSRKASQINFEDSKAKEILEQFLGQCEDLGRTAEDDEFEPIQDLKEYFGTKSRALRIISHAYPQNKISERSRERANDLLVFLALSKFQGRPPLHVLPIGLQRDIRSFFSSYKNACGQADTLLFQAGNPEAINLACMQSQLGKLLPSALYVHRDYLERLSPILRIYVGCAQVLVGDVEQANLIKIHRFSGKVSYLVYEHFDKDEHPELSRSVTVFLKSLSIRDLNYSDSPNRPILHRKETFVGPDYPLYEQFRELTSQEISIGLLDDAAKIGFKLQWETRLKEKGFSLRDHQVIDEGL